MRRLLGETAVRQELWGAAAGALALAWRAAHLWYWTVFALLIALVLAVEAPNTAIDFPTDHLSPDWSQTALDKSDPGALAAALMLTGIAVFLGLVVSGPVRSARSQGACTDPVFQQPPVTPLAGVINR